MYKAVSFWSAPKPEDQEEFEKYYNEVHAPTAARVPGAVALLLTRTSDGLDAPADFYRVAELHFESKEDFEKATQTPEWAAMREDAHKVLDRFGVTLTSGIGTQVSAEMLNR